MQTKLETPITYQPGHVFQDCYATLDILNHMAASEVNA